MRVRGVWVLIACAVLIAAAQGSVASASCGGGCGGCSGPGRGQHGGHGDRVGAHSSFSSLHHGDMTFTKANAFETVVAPGGIRIYRYTIEGDPRPMVQAAGQVEVELSDGSRHKVDLEQGAAQDPDAVWFCTMHPSFIRHEAGACEICGMQLVTQDFLFASPERAYGPAQSAPTEIGVRINGLGSPEKKVKFICGGYAAAATARAGELMDANQEDHQPAAEHSGHVH